MTGPRVPFLEVGATYTSLSDELDAAYRRVMSSGWFLLGPELEAFEADFAAYSGAPRVRASRPVWTPSSWPSACWMSVPATR